MKTRIFRARKALALTAGVVLSLGFLTESSHAASSANRADSEKAKLSLDISAQRFVVEGDRVVARGPVNATVERSDGSTETIKQQVALRVKTTQNCRILDLHLAKLYLNLLGLEVRTSQINLEVTGDRKRVLGKLFCDLSESLKLDKSVLAKRAAHSLNRALDSQPLPILSFKAPVRSQQQPGSERARPSARANGDVPPVPPGSCEVLDLLLGPLHLDLLGLVVDLYGPTEEDPIEVLVTANPNGGVVGSALCQQAGTPPA